MKFNLIKISFVLLVVLFGCKTKNETPKDTIPAAKSDFTIAFGSCNNQTLKNELWSVILKNNPKVWIWGGDIIYSDTEDMDYMKQNYVLQKENTAYANFSKKVDVLGTWDDHDYGVNDGGYEYPKKNEVQQLLLDFLDVGLQDERRTREGVYHSKTYEIDSFSVKVIVLDTRYFRTPLTTDTETKKRYKPNYNTTGTMLGKTQWEWLNNELCDSTSDYHIIMSSVQFLSAEHGYESWGLMPNEVAHFEEVLANSKAKNCIILSGDRHIAEISKKEVKGLNYPLIDFTSSGMTHSYSSFKGEPNKYRIGDVIFNKNFGLLHFDFSKNEVTMEIRGLENKVLQAYTQKYN
jgi:alkaline phosphatase D